MMMRLLRHALLLLALFVGALPVWAQSVTYTKIGYWTDGPSNAVAADGSTVYYGGSANLQIADFSDPATPQPLGRVNLDGVVTAIALSGDYAYAGQQGASLTIVDVSDAANPARVGTIPDLEGVDDVQIVETTAYVLEMEQRLFGNGDLTLHVYDITDPASPALQGSVEVGERSDSQTPARIDVADGYVYVTADDGLRIVDASDPASPAEVTLVPSGSGRSIEVVAVRGDYAYTHSHDSLRVLDVSDPAAPTSVGMVEVSNMASTIALEGDYAYVSTLNPDGLLTLDLSDPSAPAEASFVELVESGPMAVGGGYAYVTPVNLFAEDSLRVLDLSDPAHPTLFNTAELGHINSPNGMTYYDGFLFTDGGIAVNAYDVTDPAHPVEANSYTDVADAVRLAIVDGTMYVAAAASGVEIVDIEATGVYAEPAPTPDAGAGLRLVSAPNPFNATARVMVSVPDAQHVRLDVYDVLGRSVATLHEGHLASGREHRFTVEAGDLPSGVYFLRATGEDFAVTRQMVRVR